MLILGESGIVTNNIANKGSHSIEYMLFWLHSPWSVQDTTPKIVDTPLTLILGGRDIITNTIAY